MTNKVYVLISHWDFVDEHECECLGVFTDKEKAKEELKNYADNYILSNDCLSYKEDECWYNEDHTWFTAYNERNGDCEWVRIEEKELI